MNLHLTGHHLEITPAIRAYVINKLDRVTRHFDHVIDVSVVLCVDKIRQIVEANVHVRGKEIHAQCVDPDMYAAIDALADKFDVVQDDRLETGRKHPFGARVSITTDDGVHERLYADPSGEPNSFPDAQAMAQKFLTLARPVLNGRADELADAILSLERFDRVAMATQLGRQ